MHRFPHDPIFVRLIEHTRTIPGVIIRDEFGINAGYNELMRDIIHVRQLLREQLPPGWFDPNGQLQRDVGFIGMMAASAYYYIVSFFAIAALGGKCVVLPVVGKPEEITYMVQKTDLSYILCEPNTTKEAAAIKEHVQNVESRHLHVITALRVEAASTLCLELETDESLKIPGSDTSMVLFTSGSTGKPKAVAIPRSRLFPPERPSVADSMTVLLFRPFHWMGGAYGPLRFTLNGIKIRYLKAGTQRSSVLLWNAIKEGNATHVTISSVILKVMQDYYHETICELPAEERARYQSGASKLQELTCIGSVLNPAVAQFWNDLTGNPPIPVYGSTELGGAMKAPPGSPFKDLCIGALVPNAITNLADGEKSELLIKVPGMFTHYIGDEEMTKRAFNDEGFFKTGDMVERIGDQYFFHGRVSSDWIRFSSFEVSVIELEHRLMRLPYVDEAYILPIMDYEMRELVAAVIRLKESTVNKNEIDLRRIRDDLSSDMDFYKLPTLLRILGPGDEVPFSSSNKPLKNQIREKFFQVSGYRPKDYAVPGVEFWGNILDWNTVKKSRSSLA